jgi:hypothetical protein
VRLLAVSPPKQASSMPSSARLPLDAVRLGLAETAGIAAIRCSTGRRRFFALGSRAPRAPALVLDLERRRRALFPAVVEASLARVPPRTHRRSTARGAGR